MGRSVTVTYTCDWCGGPLEWDGIMAHGWAFTALKPRRSPLGWWAIFSYSRNRPPFEDMEESICLRCSNDFRAFRRAKLDESKKDTTND